VKTAALLITWFLALLALYLLGRRWAVRQQIRERVFAQAGRPPEPTPGSAEEAGWLTRWLFLAGYQGPGAALGFLGATLLGAGVGLLAVFTLYVSGLVARAEEAAALAPRVITGLLGPLVSATPWGLLSVCTALPWLVVREARRRRVEQIEQDLPLFLELLATLGESGLGFDASLDRILAAQPEARPLAREWRTFQGEVLAGRPRIQCLRRLARRVDVMPFTIFISALVQAEQVGSGVADVLRRQADDLRDRRRERSLALAAALPVKLMFPLIICFLPGIFVVTLGPTFHEFLKRADSIMPRSASR
jgi:pilus assembly protein TadC